MLVRLGSGSKVASRVDLPSRLSGDSWLFIASLKPVYKDLSRCAQWENKLKIKKNITVENISDLS